MAKESTHLDVHRCECSICRDHPRGRVAATHREINRLLAVSDERSRRLLVAFLAEQIGRGGISQLARVSGMDRKTIAKGRRELHDSEFSAPSHTDSLNTRVRRPGAGRKRVEIRHPG